MIVAMVLSIWLFSNQTNYVGVVPRNHPAFGDLTFEVGFAIAALLYWGMYLVGRSRPDELPPALVEEMTARAPVA